MIRIKRGSIAHKRRKKILKTNKSFVTSSTTLFRVAKQKNLKAKLSSYTGRKNYKKLIRKLWINRINSSLKLFGSSYSKFINLYKLSRIQLNRKSISQLIIYDPELFFNELNSFL